VLQVIPKDETHDFWWLHQSCEMKGNTHLQDCILQDNQKNNVNFYDAFTCLYQIPNTSESMKDIDTNYKDSNTWDATLNGGSIGIYQTQEHNKIFVFMVCMSDISSVAAEVIGSMKSDIANELNVFDFCNSKEIWFLENLSRRNRLRLIYQTAIHLGLKVSHCNDIYAHHRQQNSEIAIESCATNLESLECICSVDHISQKKKQSVRHFKACVDIKKQNGPLPIFLGESIGYMLMLPDIHNAKTFCMLSDASPFIQDTIPDNVYLFPNTNIFEDNIYNTQKISEEHQKMSALSIEDILYDVQQRNAIVPEIISHIFRCKHKYGEFPFYGVRYFANSPIVIYPKFHATYINCTIFKNDTSIIDDKHYLNSNNTTENRNYNHGLEQHDDVNDLNEDNGKTLKRYNNLPEIMSSNFELEIKIDKIKDVFGFCVKGKKKQLQVGIEFDHSLVKHMLNLAKVDNVLVENMLITPFIVFSNNMEQF